MRKRYVLIGIGISFFYFIIHIFIMNYYGVSWDFYYHLYAGLYHLGLPFPQMNDPSPIPFSSPDPRLTVLDPFGPFTQIIPALSYVLFYQTWHILPPDSAYNIPMIIFGSLGILVLFFFLLELFRFPIALFGSLFLSLTPNYFGYLHTNMKDIPNAFAFTLALYLFWRLVIYRRTKDLIFAILAFAFAFNVKINSIMIPVVCFFWYFLSYFREFFPIKKKRIYLIMLYFILAPFTALLLWIPFWKHPFAKLFEFPSFYSHNTLNMPVLFLGHILRSGVNIPWDYPYVYIAITTPLPILLGAITGLAISIYYIFIKKERSYLLLIVWFFVPLFRYLSPKASAIDGVRHFMEVVYPIASFAAIGYVSLISSLRKRMGKAIAFIHILVFFFLVKNIVVYHPYQTSFFNSLIGGIAGAQGKFDIDFWATPQKETILWLNEHVPYSAYVHIVMAQSSAAIYIRDDLLRNLNKKDMFASDYTVLLNRQSFFSLYPVEAYLLQNSRKKEIVYERKIENVPLVYVFKNE